MLFIWGKKVVRNSIGFVADFCPVCRGLSTFEMTRIGLASHIYYIAAGEGALISHVRTCSGCGINLNGRPEAYLKIEPTRLATSELAAATRPDWEQAHAQRLALERTIAMSPEKLPADVRKVLVCEPFELLAPRVDERFSRSHFDPRTAAAAVLLTALLFIALFLANRYPANGGTFFGVALVIGVVAVVWQLMSVKKRYFAKEVFPILARALNPLRPTIAELEAAKSEVRAGGHKLGKMLNVAALARHMGPAPAPRRATMLDDPEVRGSHAA